MKDLLDYYNKEKELVAEDLSATEVQSPEQVLSSEREWDVKPVQLIDVSFPEKLQWGEVINGSKCFPLHADQTIVLERFARFTAAVAGTGGGKTVLGPVWILDQLQRIREGGRNLKQFPIKGMVVAPTFPVMARATAPTLVQTFEGTELEGRYVESKNRYFLPHNLGTIWMLSADRSGGLEGGQFDFAWLDEGGQISYDSWIAVQGRLGQLQSPALITTTPYFRNWLYHRFYLYWKSGNPDYFVHQWASYLNPAYPRDEYDRAKREMTHQRFAMRYGGQFVKMAGLVYPDIQSCVESFDELPEGRMYGGLDFGWNDPFCAIAGILDEKGCIWIWYERYVRNVSIQQHARVLPPNVTWFADSSRPDSINDLRRQDIIVRPNKVHEILVGVDAVNASIYSEKLKIHPNCRALVTETNEYVYPEGEDEETKGEKPVGGFDHACDAIRYLVSNVRKYTA